MASPDRYYLDTNSVIGMLERQSPFAEAQLAFLASIDEGSVACASSELTLAECLVLPFRTGTTDRIDAVLEFLDDRPQLPLLKADRACFIRAALIRAGTGMRLPDALHVALAEMGGCTVFMSADAGIRLPASMRRMAFDDIALES